MKPFHTLALAASFTGACSAATIVQTGNYSFVPNGNQVLTFNKFDTSLGTLTGVSVSVTLLKTGGSLQVDNDSATAGTINLTHEVQASLASSLGSTSLLNTSFATIGTTSALTATNTLTNQAIAATSGDATDQFNVTGQSDYLAFNPGNVSASDSGNVNSNFTSLYEGTGTFTDTLTANQLVNVTGLGGLQQAFTVSSVSGAVVITYTYDAVPEPASPLLGGLGVLMLLRRRRR